MNVRFFKLFVHFLAVALLAACATKPVFHAFSFNMAEAPGIELVDYSYGTTRVFGAQATEREKASGGVQQSTRINGEMLRGDFLYVKWRLQINGAIYEDRVNLNALLPPDITDHEIYFKVDGLRLRVYLITPHRRRPDEPQLGPAMYHYRRVLEISSNYGREVTR